MTLTSWLSAKCKCNRIMWNWHILVHSFMSLSRMSLYWSDLLALNFMKQWCIMKPWCTKSTSIIHYPLHLQCHKRFLCESLAMWLQSLGHNFDLPSLLTSHLSHANKLTLTLMTHSTSSTPPSPSSSTPWLRWLPPATPLWAGSWNTNCCRLNWV